MTKTLTLDEMLEVLPEDERPLYESALNNIGTLMAHRISLSYGVEHTPSTTDMGMTAAAFYAPEPMPCPSPLRDYDPEEWTTLDGTMIDPETGALA